MDLQLKATAAFAETPGLVPRIHMGAHSSLQFLV